MSERTWREDPIAYRIEYARIARLLEKELTPEPKTKAPRDEEAVKTGAAPGLKLSPRATRAIDSALRGLTPEQRQEGRDHENLSLDAAALASEACDQLRQLRWKWVGRRPAWWLRWLGWRHWRRRREYLALADFLDGVLEPASIVLYCSCLIEEGNRDDARALARDLRRSSATAQQPLRRPGPQGRSLAPDSSDPWLLAYLHQLLWQDPAEQVPQSWWRAMLFSLELDVKLTLAWLGVTRWRRPAQPNHRARYNLACLLSRLLRRLPAKDPLSSYCLKEAEHQLQFSLEALHGARREALAEKARRDPALSGLRDAPGSRFDEILPPPSPSSPAA